MGGTALDYGYGIVADASGSVYTTGYFLGTSDYNPGVGVSTLTSAGAEDIFLSKLDSAGNFVWAISLGGTGGDRGFAVAVDPVGGLYLAGHFAGTVDFDPGLGSVLRVSAGGLDGFVSKLDTDGNLVWVAPQGGTGDDALTAVALDSGRNVYTTGGFQGMADMDPGAGVANVSSAGGNDYPLSKLDPTGAFVWAESIGGTGADDGLGIAVGSADRVYVTGGISGIVSLNSVSAGATLTGAGSLDACVLRLDSVIAGEGEGEGEGSTETEGEGEVDPPPPHVPLAAWPILLVMAAVGAHAARRRH